MTATIHSNTTVGQDTLIDYRPSMSSTDKHRFYITLGQNQVSCIELEYFKTPTIATIEAMNEANKKKGLKRFDTVEDFFNDLND
jgi:hypothetical protein